MLGDKRSEARGMTLTSIVTDLFDSSGLLLLNTMALREHDVEGKHLDQDGNLTEEYINIPNTYCCSGDGTENQYQIDFYILLHIKI